MPLGNMAGGQAQVSSILKEAIALKVQWKAEEKGKPLPAAQGCLAGDCTGCGASSLCTGKSSTNIDVDVTVNAAAKETATDGKGEK